MCSFNNYLQDFCADIFPDYFGMDENYEIINNGDKKLLCRKASPYLRNAMLLGKVNSLIIGNYYKLSVNIKLNKFAQTLGAVKLLMNASVSYPWAPVTEYNKENPSVDNYKNDYLSIVSIKDLLSGEWKKVEFIFLATSQYIALQTPGYVELLFDDFIFEDLGTDEISTTTVEYFKDYNQIRVKQPKFYNASAQTTDCEIELKEDKILYYNVSSKDYKISKYNLLDYKIVVPRVRSYLYTEALNKLFAVLTSARIKLELTYDDVAEGDKLIFVGNTKFSKKIENKNEYCVYVKKDNLFINGGSDLSVYACIIELADIIKNNAEVGKATVFESEKEFLSGIYTSKDDDYTLTYSDEFDTDFIDKKHWGTFWDQGTRNVTANNSLGGGKRCASPLDKEPYAITKITKEKIIPLEVKDSMLRMRTAWASEIFENGEKLENSENDTLGSCISTISSMHYKYGVLEVSCKIAGGRNYAAIWANGDVAGVVKKFPQSARTAFSEIDLTESFGYGDYAAPCVHKWWSNEKGFTSGHSSLDEICSDGYGNWREKQIHDNEREDFLGKGHYFSTEQHIYTFAWTPDNITLAIDGKVVWDYDYTQYTSTSICNLSKHIIISNGISKHTTVDDPDFSEQSIDYVRLYQIQSRGDELIYSNSLL